MFVLTWQHTRKGTPMVLRGSFAQAMLTVWRVRAVVPGHPFALNGAPL